MQCMKTLFIVLENNASSQKIINDVPLPQTCMSTQLKGPLPESIHDVLVSDVLL